MIEFPEVGQVVRLNDGGMRQIGGISTNEMYRQSQRMVITAVENAMCDDQPTFVLNVDQPLINQFIFTNWDVDEVTE